MRSRTPLLTISMLFLSLSSLHSQWTQNSLTNTDVRALAVSGTNLFAGTYQGGVFLSTNNGTSWTAVNTGLTNTSVLALAVSGTNLFAGTTGGVFLSTNNGSSWTGASTGLATLLSILSPSPARISLQGLGSACFFLPTMAQAGLQSA